ncbi:MAG: NAD(P)-binding domain-containing protein, partial [Acidobacteria bacterium]|nr:NAD(P)-binding domain-containing protein [Acidobacteriota bacterium]
MSSETVGFVGIGRMGGPMCGRLLDAGHRVVVFDVDAGARAALAARGAVEATSPEDVASQASVVLISLPTPAIVETVVLGPRGVSTGSRVKVIIDLSTTGPSAAARIAAALGPSGVAWVDAPVSGGVKGARDGTLAVMV